jgi:hypothetical protein
MCRGASADCIEQGFQVLPDNLRAIVEEINRRSPAARVIFVDYATILPDSGTCGRLTLTEQEAAEGRQIAEPSRTHR